MLLLDHFREAFLNGIFYPRWLPNAFGGYGCPTFLFYQPGFFFIALAFSCLPGYPVLTMHLTLIFLFFIGGVGAYKLCRELSDAITGFLCAIMFILTPYLYVNLYVRGDLSELMAMLLLPWPIFLLILLKGYVQKHIAVGGLIGGIAIFLLMILISHPATALFFLPVFCLIAVFTALDMGPARRKFLFSITISVVLGLVLSSPYWFTLFQMKKYVNIEQAVIGYYSADRHVVYLHQLFSPKWGFGASFIGSGDGMPFPLGLPHFILATIGVLFAKRIRAIRISYALYILLILLMTPLATKLWRGIILFRYVQFPWRILSVTAVLQVICITGLKNITVKWKPSKRIKVTLFLILITGLWYSNQFLINSPINGCKALKDHKKGMLANFYTYSRLGEFMPRTAKLRPPSPRGNAPMLVFTAAGETYELKGNSPYRVRYKVVNETSAGVLINQIYIPGWEVLLDGISIPRAELEKNLTEDGRIRLFLPSKGEHIIEAFYEGPPGWFVRNIIIGIAFLGFIVFCIYDKKSCANDTNEH